MPFTKTSLLNTLESFEGSDALPILDDSASELKSATLEVLNNNYIRCAQDRVFCIGSSASDYITDSTTEDVVFNYVPYDASGMFTTDISGGETQITPGVVGVVEITAQVDMSDEALPANDVGIIILKNNSVQCAYTLLTVGERDLSGKIKVKLSCVESIGASDYFSLRIENNTSSELEVFFNEKLKTLLTFKYIALQVA